MKRNHIVFVLGSYYPNASANGLCVMKIIEILKVSNKITVVCNNTQSNLTSIESYNGYNIIRTETLDIKLRNHINTILLESKSKAMNIIARILLIIVKAVSYLKSIITSKNVNNQMINEFVRAMSIIDEPIDLIIPVCFPIESVIAAIEFNRIKNNSIKIVPYLLDKFAESNTLHRTNWNKKLKMKAHLKLEEFIFKNSEKIVTTNDWRNHIYKHFSKYNNKVLYTNLPTLVPGNKSVSLNYDQNKIHLVYTGGLNKKNRSPKYMLNFLSECFNKNTDLTLHLYVNGNCNSIIENYTISNPKQIFNHGSVSFEVAQSAILGANILVSIGNFDITQTPSKIYEYISSGKPIIHFYQKQEDPVIEILEKYPMSLCIKQDDSKFDNNVDYALEFINMYKLSTKINYEDIRKIYYNATPNYTAEIFQNIV